MFTHHGKSQFSEGAQVPSSVHPSLVDLVIVLDDLIESTPSVGRDDESRGIEQAGDEERRDTNSSRTRRTFGVLVGPV
jgi:hypothetical protein